MRKKEKWKKGILKALAKQKKKNTMTKQKFFAQGGLR